MFSIKNTIQSIIGAWIDSLFPRTCCVCGKRIVEGFICDGCMDAMPDTGQWYTAHNMLTVSLKSFAPIEHAASLFYYKPHCPYTNIILNLKYRNQRGIAYAMGCLIGTNIKLSPFIPTPDYIIPVPLHPSRERWRGYNQSYHIALGIASVLGCSINQTAIKRHKKGHTQALIGSGRARRNNLKDAFTTYDTKPLRSKNILIVDDIITTGATLGQCAATLHKSCPSAHLYVSAIACRSLERVEGRG